jgi:hypothetical protein
VIVPFYLAEFSTYRTGFVDGKRRDWLRDLPKSLPHSLPHSWYPTQKIRVLSIQGLMDGRKTFTQRLSRTAMENHWCCPDKSYTMKRDPE